MAKEDRRVEILRAASRVFYIRGFEGTKIEDIAKEAGIGKGTVYEYFDSKQQLFDEAIQYNRSLYIRSVEKVLETGTTFREKFLALAKYQTELVKNHLHIFSVMSCSKIMAREMGALMLEQNIRVGDLLKKHLEEGITRGELRAELDAEMASALIMGTINQYCSKKVIFFNIDPSDIDFDRVVDTVMKGIGN